MPLRNFNNNQSFIPQEDPDDKLKRIAGMTEYDDWKFAKDRGAIPDNAVSVMYFRPGAKKETIYSDPTMMKDGVSVSYPRSYWNNPQRVARMHEVIDNAPDGWKAPEWLDVEGVENLYRYYEYKNPGKSWEDWDNLQSDDPGIDLANYLDQPPQEYLSNIDQDPAYKQYRAVQNLVDKYNEAQAKIQEAQDNQNQIAASQLQATYAEELTNTWDKLEPWQQFLSARDTMTNVEGRPEWTYGAAAGWSGIKTALSVMGMSSMMLGLTGMITGTSLAPGVGTAIGAVLGAGIGAYSAYKAYRNEQNEITQVLNFFNIPAENLEKVIGTLVTEAEIRSRGEDIEKYGGREAIWQAAQGTYESQVLPIGNWEANAVSAIAHLLNPEWSSGTIAHLPAGEVWKIEQGYATPQLVKGGILAGDALAESAMRIHQGEDPTIVYEDMVKNFGYSGTRADFVAQNLLDPTQLAPYLVNKAGLTYANNVGDFYLRDALAANKGKIAIDVLPMFYQQGAEWFFKAIGKEEIHGTGNIFGALQDYGLRLRTSYTGNLGEYIPASDYNKMQMYFGGLTKNTLGEVVVKNLEPYSPDPISTNKVRALANYLGENTPESKAVMYSVNFTSALERVMAYAGGDPNTFIDMLKASVSGDDKDFQYLAGHYLSSPEMVSIRGGLEQYLNNEKTKTNISIWNATAPKRILLENLALAASQDGNKVTIAKVLDMLGTQETAEELFKMIADNPRTDNRIVRMMQARIDPNTPNLKASDRVTIDGLQKRMDKFIDGSVVYHPDAMLAKLRNGLEDAIRDHLVNRYGLKADGFISRLASLNKAVQSTLLLGLSPSYFANNYVDGMVNLAYNGAYGLMSPSHVAKLWEDMEMPKPSRINEGFGPGSVVASIYNDLNPNDVISELHKIVGWGNNKLGIFTALSDKVEKLQGATATTVGFMQYMRNNWKEGVGFGKLPAELEDSIRQAGGDPNKLYKLIREAKSANEIRNIFANQVLDATKSVRVVLEDGTIVSRTQLETLARVHSAIEKVGEEVYGSNSDALLSDLIVKTGLDSKIVDSIREGVPEKQAINDAITELREAVNTQVTNDIISRIQADEALITTEGTRVTINILNEMKANYLSRHAVLRTQEFSQTANVYALRNKSLWGQADAYYDTFVKATQDEIKMLSEDYGIRLGTILRTLDPDSAVHRPMINALLTQKKIWDNFYQKKTDLWNEFRLSNHANYDAEKLALIDEINRLEKNARIDEAAQQDVIDHGYLDMLGTTEETRAYVEKWLAKTREMQKVLIEKDEAFFDSIKTLRATDPQAAAAAFTKYNIDTYTPYLAKMLEASEAAEADLDKAIATATRNEEIDAQRNAEAGRPANETLPIAPKSPAPKDAEATRDTKAQRALTIDQAREYLYDAETRAKVKAVEDALYDGIKRAFPGSSDAALRSSLDLFRMKADVWAVNNKTTPLDFWKPYTSIENAETMQPPDALAKMILENNSKYGPTLNEKDTRAGINLFLTAASEARSGVAQSFMAETKRLFPSIKKEQYQFVDSYIEMMANAYAKKYNKTPDDYYKDVWASRKLVNDDTKDPISRAMMKYNREGSGLVTFDQYGKALLRTTEIADIKTFLRENWHVMSRLMLDPEDIDYIADHYSKGTMTGADFTLNRAKLANGQNLIDYGVPGYRHGETEASQEYRVKGGWKLNLTVDESKYAAVDEWLDKNTPKLYKLLMGGDEGKNDFTIYVGSKAQANALAEKIAKEIPSLLLPNASDETYRVFNEYVKGRFDIQTSQTPTPYKYYGLNGIPFDAEGSQSSFSRVLYKDQERKLNATNTMARVDKDLTRTFGEYYTGKSASGEELIDMAGVTRAELDRVDGGFLVVGDQVAKLIKQMEEDLVNDCETLWTKKGADIAPSRLVQLVGKIQQFFKDMYKSLTQRNLDDNPQLEAVLKKIIFPTGEEDPDVKPATHEPVPPDKGQILAATIFKQGNDYRQAIIRGTKAADMQSFMHEMLHTTLYTLQPNEIDTLAKYAGFKNGDEYLLYRELRDFNSLEDSPEIAAKLKAGEDKLINEAINAIGNNKLDSYPAPIRNVFVKIKNALLAIWRKTNQQQPDTQWSEDVAKAFHSWILGSERDLQAYQMAVDAGMKAKAIATGTAQGPVDLTLGNGQTYSTRYTAINLDELKEPFVPINYNSDLQSLQERAERVKIEANEDLVLAGFPDVYRQAGEFPTPNYKQAEAAYSTLQAELDALGTRPVMTDEVMAFYRNLQLQTETVKANFDEAKEPYSPKLKKQLATLAQLTSDYEKMQAWDAKAAEVETAKLKYEDLKAKAEAKLADPAWINQYKNYTDLVAEMNRVTEQYNAIKEGRNKVELDKVRRLVPKEWFNSSGTRQAINNDDLMILIHSDGRIMYDPNNIRHLLRPYQAPVKTLSFVDKGDADQSTIDGVLLRDYGLTEEEARTTYRRLRSGELSPAQVDKNHYQADAHNFAINEYHDFKQKNMTRFGLTQGQVDDPSIVVALMPELDYETLSKATQPGNIYELYNISATSRTPLVLKPLISELTDYAKTPAGKSPIANAYIIEVATTLQYLPFRDVDGKVKAIIHPTASANDIIEAINAERVAPLINSLPGVLDIIEYSTLNSWNKDMIYKLVLDTLGQKIEKFERTALKNSTPGEKYSADVMKNFIVSIDQTIHEQLQNSASLGKYAIYGPDINQAVRMPLSEMPNNVRYHIDNSLKYFLSNVEYLIDHPTPTKLIISDAPIVEPFFKDFKEMSNNVKDGRVSLPEIRTALIEILADNYNKDNPLQQQLLRQAILDKVNTPEVSYYYHVAPYNVITKRIDQVTERLDQLTRRLAMGVRNGLSKEAFQNEVDGVKSSIKEYDNALAIAKAKLKLANNKETTSANMTKAIDIKKDITRLTAGLNAYKELLKGYEDTGGQTEPLFYKEVVARLTQEYERVNNLYHDSKELGGLLTGYQKQTIKQLLDALKARIDNIRAKRDAYDVDRGKPKTKSPLTASQKLTATKRQAALEATEMADQEAAQSTAVKQSVMNLAQDAKAAGYEGGYKPKTLNGLLSSLNYKNKLADFLKVSINLKEGTGDEFFGALFYNEDQVPEPMRAGMLHNLRRLIDEIEKYNTHKQDPEYLPPVIQRNMVLLATDDIDMRQKKLMSGQKRGIDNVQDVAQRLIDKGLKNLTPYNMLELELLGAEYIAVAETPWHVKSDDPAQREKIEDYITLFAPDDMDYKPDNVATQTVGQRAGVTPVPLNQGLANQEVFNSHLSPILDGAKLALDQDKGAYDTNFAAKLTADQQKQLSDWVNRTAAQLTTTKYNAREWGVMQRDYALLNYKDRTNLDTFMDLVFPYQFWFTRNARNWAMKSLSRPGLIAQVVRREEMMRKNGQYLGKLPKRLQEKMRVPWAFGEDWMGDSLYFNPFKNLFPPNNLMSVFDNLDQSAASVNPTYMLQNLVADGQITQEEMDEAIEKKSGKAWDLALKLATEENREELSNPVTMASMMMSPSMLISEVIGTNPKDNLPITKTGIAVHSFGKRVGGILEPISEVLSRALEAPERLLRGNNFSYYGRWGDYVIKRAIASNVADKTTDYDAGMEAMTTMKGPAYEEATRRVEAELAMKLPGSSLANTVADQAWSNIPQALVTTLFPTGIYPKGEMELMGLTEQMQAAWDEYGKGNPIPIDDLFKEHPELLVKSGINDEPELLMKKLLINNIREKYDALDSINKGIVKQQLGDAFVESLLSGKIDYDNITKEDLLIWTDAFGEQLPEGEQIPVTSKLPGVETFTDDQVAEISGYLDIREQRYPNHAWLQQNYAAITDPIEKKKYLAKFPELTHYWDWNKEYKHAHPIIDQWSAYYGNAGTAYQDPYFGLNKNIIQGYLDKKAELFPNITWQQEVYFNLITDEERYAFLDANPDLAKAWDWDAKMEASNPNIKMYKQLREAQFAMYQSQPETETGEEHTPAEQSRRLSLLGLHPYVVQELLIYKANKTPYSSGTKSVLQQLYVAMGKPTETLEEFINSLY